MSNGREFHMVGAATPKALSPKVRLFALGTERRSKSADRRVRDRVGLSWRRSERYCGARAF